MYYTKWYRKKRAKDYNEIKYLFHLVHISCRLHLIKLLKWQLFLFSFASSSSTSVLASKSIGFVLKKR